MSKTWYGYNKSVRFVDQASTIESTRDTDSTIFYIGWNGKERRMKKRTSWETWVDSVEELERMIAAGNKQEEAKRKDMLVRDAAPTMLAALTSVKSLLKLAGLTSSDEYAEVCFAIAKAKGDQQ